jgi:hypothetical protein
MAYVAYVVGALVGMCLVLYPWLAATDRYLASLGLREWLGIAFASTFLLLLLSTANPVALPLVVGGGTLVAQALIIFLDVKADPTAHNLFPFELVIAGAVSCVGAAAGTAAAVIGKTLLDRARRT